MSDTALAQSVEAFATLTQDLADADLNRPWAWGAYDSEGVRFAFFRVYEELRTLAVKLARARLATGRPLSSAQRVLGQYHLAYRDLQAALLGVPAASLDDSPAEGEWSVHQTLAHIVEADFGFYAVVTHALNQLRDGVAEPGRITQEAYDAIFGMDEAAEIALLQGPLEEMLAFHSRFHARILRELGGIQEAELDLPSMYWEGYPLGVRFRLHRFDAHMRQHTVQIDKTLAMLGQGPTEARRLLRLIYAALAEVEGTLPGADDAFDELPLETSAAIARLTAEIAPLVA